MSLNGFFANVVCSSLVQSAWVVLRISSHELMDSSLWMALSGEALEERVLILAVFVFICNVVDIIWKEFQVNIEMSILHNWLDQCPFSWFSYNRPLVQIPQCICLISHNAPFCNKNVNVYTFLLQNGALWDIGLWEGSIATHGILLCRFLLSTLLN